jgi:hypothetical protein
LDRAVSSYSPVTARSKADVFFNEAALWRRKTPAADRTLTVSVYADVCRYVARPSLVFEGIVNLRYSFSPSITLFLNRK